MKRKLLLILISLLILTSCISKEFIDEVYVDGNKNLKSFYIFKYNTTVKDYNKYLSETGEKTNYNDDTWEFSERALYDMIKNEDCAVANLSFFEIVKYANWLSEKRKLKPAYIINENGTVDWNKNANGYRLPTYAEWQWAAKGGKKSKGYKYPGSDILDEVAWYKDNSDNVIHEPGLKKPNELGIYDMFGNVGEWCWDVYIIFAGDVILEGDNKTPSSEWENKRKTFSATNEVKWQYKDLQDVLKLDIPIDLNYIKKNQVRINIFTPFWKNEKEISENYLIYSVAGFSGYYQGIRLVRNTK